MQQYAPAQFFPSAAPYYIPEGAFHPNPAWGPQNVAVPLSSPPGGVYPYGPPLQQGAPPPMQRPKHSSRISRSHREAQDTRTAVPLRSAMKKRPSAAGGPVRPGTPGPRPTTPRSRSSSGARSVRLPAGAMTRQRTNSGSMQEFKSDHLLVSLHGNNEIRFEGLRYQETIDDLREYVFCMWPHGTDDDAIRGHRYRIAFRRTPWNCSGHERLIAWRMLSKLFLRLALQGYHYSASINTGNRSRPPRHVFIEKQPTEVAYHFFPVTFSRNGEKVTLIDPPDTVRDSIGVALRNIFPHRVSSDKVTEDSLCVIELKKGVIGVPNVDKTMFMAYVLTHLRSLGYNLDASVPLARRGPLGLGGRKEVWIFKSRVEA